MEERDIVIQQEKELVGLCKEAKRGGITRRQFVERALILGLSAGTVGALAAACGESEEEGGGAPAVEMPPMDETMPAEITVYNWTDYMDPDIRKQFNRVGGFEGFVRELHARGIAIQGCFVFGLDGDDPDVFQRTVDFVYETNIDLPQFSIYTPFPGTEAHRRLEAEGRILERNWSLYDAEHVVFQPAQMSRERLFEGLLYAWRQAYTLRSIAKYRAEP